MKAAIVGVTGYTGIELIRLIQQHPQLEVGTLHSHSMHENSSVLYPHLIGLTERLIEPFDAEKIQKENQLVFLRLLLESAKNSQRLLSQMTFQ